MSCLMSDEVVRRIPRIVDGSNMYPSVRVRVRVTERKLRRKPHP